MIRSLPIHRCSRGARIASARLVIALVAAAGPIFASAQAPSAKDECANVDLATVPAQPVPIRYGLTGGGEEPLALLWADKASYPGNGRFYSLEPQKYASNDRMTAVQAGQIDAGSISLTALITGVRVGLDLRAVASIVETSDQDNQGAFVSLIDGGVGDAAQWKNKRIGYYGPNTISEYWVKSALRRAGLNPAEARYVSLPPPAQEQALRNHQIDVAWLSRQFLAKAEKTGGVKVVLRPMQATAQAHPSTLVFFTRQFVNAHPQAYCAWRRDYQKALENWRAGRDGLYAKLIAAKYLTPAAADAGPDGGRAEGGRINVHDVQATIEDMVGAGFLPAARTVAAEDLLMKGYALRK